MNQEKTGYFYQNFLKKKRSDDGDEQDDDQNFIKKDEEVKSSSDEKRNQVFSKLVSEIKEVVAKLSEPIRPKVNQVRTLDSETGGKEIDYAKVMGDGKDVWDEQSAPSEEGVAEGTEFESTNNRSFISKKKIEKMKNKKHGKKDAALDSLGFAEGLKRSRQDSKESSGKSPAGIQLF